MILCDIKFEYRVFTLEKKQHFKDFSKYLPKKITVWF